MPSSEHVLLDSGAGVDACPWDYAPDTETRELEADDVCKLTNVSGGSVDARGMKEVQYRTTIEGQPLVIEYRAANVRHPACAADAVTSKGYWIAIGPIGGFIAIEPVVAPHGGKMLIRGGTEPPPDTHADQAPAAGVGGGQTAALPRASSAQSWKGQVFVRLNQAALAKTVTQADGSRVRTGVTKTSCKALATR